jgi:hypothetical protein
MVPAGQLFDPNDMGKDVCGLKASAIRKREKVIFPGTYLVRKREILNFSDRAFDSLFVRSETEEPFLA